MMASGIYDRSSIILVLWFSLGRSASKHAHAQETRHVSMHGKFRVSHVLESVLLFA